MLVAHAYHRRLQGVPKSRESLPDSVRIGTKLQYRTVARQPAAFIGDARGGTAKDNRRNYKETYRGKHIHFAYSLNILITN